MMERFRLKRQQTPNPIIESKPEPEPELDPNPNPHPGFENEQELDPPKNDDVVAQIPPPIPDNAVEDQEQEASFPLRPSMTTMNEEEDPFMGLKVRRMASCLADYKGDYIDLPSRPPLLKILHKQGDKQVLFADKVLKLTGSGKLKRRIMLITEFSIYIIDPEADVLKRRIALNAVAKICLSALSDNFFAIIIPTEYDLLMISTRKTEIVTVLIRATKKAFDNELKLGFANSFEYQAASDLPKEINFEEVEGGVKTTILRR